MRKACSSDASGCLPTYRSVGGVWFMLTNEARRNMRVLLNKQPQKKKVQ